MYPSLTILGSGYTAQFLWPFAERRYARILATSRNPDIHLSHLKPDQRVRFDLAQSDTWPSIPAATDVLWCFPAAPLELVRQFAEAASLHTRRLVVLGSTSAYDLDAIDEYPPPWVDESTPIDLIKERVQGEEFLRTVSGAIVLRVAGIYGPGRNPLEWIRTGRVTRSRKYVNLIHVEDLALTCLAALRHGESKTSYNVSDGTPRTWSEICETVEQRWGIRSSAAQEAKPTGKRLLNKRLCGLLSSDCVGLGYSDLFEALDVIQRNALNEAGPSR